MKEGLKSFLRLVIAIAFLVMAFVNVFTIGLCLGGGSKGVAYDYADAIPVALQALSIFAIETVIIYIIRKPIGISDYFIVGIGIIDIGAMYFLIKWYIEDLTDSYHYPLYIFYNVFGACVIALYLGTRIWHMVVMIKALKAQSPEK